MDAATVHMLIFNTILINDNAEDKIQNPMNNINDKMVWTDLEEYYKDVAVHSNIYYRIQLSLIACINQVRNHIICGGGSLRNN